MTPYARTYSVASGPINGGRFAGGRFTGALALGNDSVSGAFASNASAFSGALALDNDTVNGAMVGYVLPTWLSGKPLNEWFTISGTSGAGGSAVQAYSGMTVRDDTSEIFIAAAGGHFDSSDNRVVSLDLRQDAPSWTTRMAASASVQQDVARYADGKPTSRHTYHSTQWCAPRSRLLLQGVQFAYGNAFTFYNFEAFNPATNVWESSGYLADIPAGANYGAARDNNGNTLSQNGFRKWTQATDTFSAAISPPGAAATQVRFPWAYDPTRTQWFGMAYGDGQNDTSWGAFIRGVKMSNSGLTQVAVTFNSSAALTQLNADAPAYAALIYDPDNDRFLFCSGQTGREGVVYVVTPNASSVWDVSILAQGGGSLTPPNSGTGGLLGRFQHVPAYKGIAFMPDKTANLYFMRLA